MQEETKEYILSCYEDVRLLHQSERGEIWLALHQVSQNLFVKRILPFSESGLKTFELLKPLKHPNLLGIIGVINLHDKLFIIEEYIEGGNLADLLKENRVIREQEVLSIIRQLCQALNVLHSSGIVHRDIKPSNLMINKEGIVKLIDFGAARIFNRDSDRDTRLLGTEGYASPEQFGFAQTDPRADIYALGATAYELLTGELPRGGMKYNGKLKGIIKKCLQFDPGKRYQSAKEVEKAIDYILNRKKLIKITGVSAILIIFILFYSIEYYPSKPSISDDVQPSSNKLTEEAIVTEPPGVLEEKQNDSTAEAVDTDEVVTVTVDQPLPNTLMEGSIATEPSGGALEEKRDNLTVGAIDTDPAITEDTANKEPTADSSDNTSEFPDLANVLLTLDGYHELMKNEAIIKVISDIAGSTYHFVPTKYNVNEPIVIRYDETEKLFYASNDSKAIEIWQDGTIGVARVEYSNYQVIRQTNNKDRKASTYMNEWIKENQERLDYLYDILHD